MPGRVTKRSGLMLKPMGSIWIVVAALAAILVLVLATKDGRDGYVARQVSELRARTVPPGADASSQNETSWSSGCAETSWEFRAGQGWQEYATWVQRQLSPDFKLQVGDGYITATRLLSGDAHYLRIEPTSEGPPTEVRIHFRSCAD